VAGQKPRQGWIYWINPYRVSLRCKLGHVHIYNLDEPGEVECQSCKENINSSRVFRGTHPYIIWTSDQFQDESGYDESLHFLHCLVFSLVCRPVRSSCLIIFPKPLI